MEQINSYKIRCLFDSIIRSRLSFILKERWRVESDGVEYKNNAAHGKFLVGNYDCSKYTPFEMATIVTGDLERFNLVQFSHFLLDTSKYTNKTNKDQVLEQNKIIQLIYNSKIENDKTGFTTILNSQYVLDELKELLYKLDKTINKSSQVKKEVEFILDTDQTGKGFMGYQVNATNEANAIKLKEVGNGYLEAGEYYRAALNLDGLSNLTKSQIYSNSATTIYRKIIECNQVINNNEGVEGMVRCDTSLRQALLNRPAWFKPYYTLSLVSYRLELYNQALEYINSSLFLNQSDAESKQLKLKIESAIKIRLPTTTKRDFNNEAETRINELGNVFVNHPIYKERMDLNQDIVFKITRLDQNLAKSLSTKLNVPIEQVIEKSLNHNLNQF